MNIIPMKSRHRVAVPLFLAVTCSLLCSGCLNLKPVSDPTRYFVLSASPNEDAVATAQNPANLYAKFGGGR